MTARVRAHRAIQILAAATLAAACQTETPSTNCQLAAHNELPGSPLMLSPAARIDRVAQWFVLMSVDGNSVGGNGNIVRWATIELDGQAGPERSATVPAFTAGPWFAVAGDKTAGDTVLLAFGKPAGNGVDLDLFVIAAPSDGSSPPGAPTLLASIPGGATPGTPVNVVMTSSVTGMRAVMAWVVPAAPAAPGMPPLRGPAAGAGAIKALIVAGSGQSIGSVVPIETVGGSTCLGFVSGRADVTLGYLRYETPTAAEPEWSIAELRDTANVEFTLALPLDSQRPSCPRLAPTMAGGYVVAWQDAVGSRLGMYDVTSNRFYPRLFVTAVEFGGVDVQPPLVGLGEVNRDFAVLFARARSSELWRVDLMGVRRPGVLSLPSERGEMGQISAFPLGGAVYATYADYTASSPLDGGQTADGGLAADGGVAGDAAADAASPSRAGRRLFVKISCF